MDRCEERQERPGDNDVQDDGREEGGISRRKSPAEARMSLAVLVASPGVTRRWMTPKFATAASTARIRSAVPATSADRRSLRLAGGGVSRARSRGTSGGGNRLCRGHGLSLVPGVRAR